jgi:hypothetical protein
MWKRMLPELHKYVFLGKGYSINLADIYFANEAIRRGFGENYEALMESGDYHNGPLSVYVPFGSVGVAAFLWFLFVSARALYHNYRYGDPALQQINTFLLAFFVAQTIFFITVFGAFSAQLYVFTGTIGFSVALNGGVRERPASLPAR